MCRKIITPRNNRKGWHKVSNGRTIKKRNGYLPGIFDINVRHGAHKFQARIHDYVSVKVFIEWHEYSTLNGVEYLINQHQNNREEQTPLHPTELFLILGPSKAMIKLDPLKTWKQNGVRANDEVVIHRPGDHVCAGSA